MNAQQKRDLKRLQQSLSPELMELGLISSSVCFLIVVFFFFFHELKSLMLFSWHCSSPWP